jgi:tripartite-type tricarboxylate transporter receptor subunit TctC
MRRNFRAAILSGALPLLCAPALPLQAQSFPVRPVRFIVPFVPGGGTDTFARITGAKVSELWGQQLIVDNRPGAQGNIGTVLGAKAPPDGYTLTLAFVGTLAINPHIYKPAGFDTLKDFIAVSRGTTEPWVLAVNAASPSDVKEFIALAKKSPGKLAFGSGSSGSQLAGELFKLAAGVDLLHVPYKGTAPAVTDLIAGNVQLTASVPTSVVAHIKTGRLRAMLVTGAKRIDMLPGVPSAVEAGLPDMNVVSWYGVVAPAATPAPVLRKLNADFVQALRMPEVRDRLHAAGLTAAPSDIAEFQEEIRKDHALWGKVVAAVRIKPE